MAWHAACLGELVIDLAPHSQSEGQWLYAPGPGGAPGNVAMGLSRLGLKTIMLAKIGDEAFGQLIIDALHHDDVDTSGIRRAVGGKTRLSAVTLSAAGERDFIFYRDNPADLLLEAGEINPVHVQSAKLLHVGSLLMSAPCSAEAQAHAMRLAKEAGRLISLDPNFRASLWPSEAAMLEAGRSLIAQSNIVKLSEEEFAALAPDGNARSLWHKELKILAITKGAQGAELFTATHHIKCPGFKVDAIDTTAAGDAFTAALLAGLLESGMETADFAQILRAACAAGALAASKRGAMASLPTKPELSHFLKQG